MGARYFRLCIAVLVVLASMPVFAGGLLAQESGSAFDRVWERTDQPVSTLAVSRTWMWGPQPNTEILQEEYVEAPGGKRDVRYYDKSRMEVTDPGADPDSIWYVTNGLLVVEMITGMLQVGDEEFIEGTPADVVVAGDLEDENGPTYATLTDLAFPNYLVEPATGDTVIQRLARDGTVTDEEGLADRGVTLAYWDDQTEHNIAAPFWQFMTSSGLVLENGELVEGPLFLNAFYATGRPITEPYWATVEVAGVAQDVLLQCFERRCLTYTPGNPEGWQVEAGNVGLHYYQWRSEFDPTSPPPPPPSPTGDPADLRINEVMFQPQVGDAEWVELYNGSDAAIQLGGMRLANGSLVNQIALPDWSMPAGAYLVVVFGAGEHESDFSDGSATYYTGTAGVPFFTSPDVALYEASPSEETIVDFVGWGFAGAYLPGEAHDQAVEAGIWSNGAFFEAVGGVPQQTLQGQERLHLVWLGESIGRDADGTDTNTPADWDVLGGADALGPTPGAANISEFLENLNAILAGDTSSAPSTSPSIPMSAKDWTVMVYMDARAPELARPLAAEIQALLSAGSNNDVNIVVSYATEDAAFRAYLQDGQMRHVTVDDNPNPGSSTKLGGFITWANSNFPADNTAIVFSGHGRGWKGLFQSAPDADFLTMSELESGLASLGKNFDVIKFDTNLMANVEVAYQMATRADYMVASEQVTWGHFPWVTFIDDLKADPELTGAEVAEIMVSRHADRYNAFIGSTRPAQSARSMLATYTWAAIDLQEVESDLAPAVSTFAGLLLTELEVTGNATNPNDNSQIVIKTAARNMVSEYADSNFIDLYRFAELIDGAAGLSNAGLDLAAKGIQTAVDDAVMTMRTAPGTSLNSYGLSIYYPRTQDLPHYPSNPPATGPHVGPNTPILRSSNGFDNPLFDPQANIPTRGTHLYAQDGAAVILGPATQYHPMLDDDGFKFTSSNWAKFLHRYYKPVADACIETGSGCVTTAEVAVGTTLTLTAAGSSDSDGPAGPLNNVPAYYFWDFDTSRETGGTMPTYTEGQQYSTCTNDCDRDGDNGSDDDPDASGQVVTFSCVTPGTYQVRLMVLDEHHTQNRVANEDQRHNEGRHWLHFNVDTTTLTITCQPVSPEVSADVDEAGAGDPVTYTITFDLLSGVQRFVLSLTNELSDLFASVADVVCNVGECAVVGDEIVWTTDANDDLDEDLVLTYTVTLDDPDVDPVEIPNCVTGTVNGLAFPEACHTLEWDDAEE